MLQIEKDKADSVKLAAAAMAKKANHYGSIADALKLLAAAANRPANGGQ